jgi:hypothetical protein
LFLKATLNPESQASAQLHPSCRRKLRHGWFESNCPQRLNRRFSSGTDTIWNADATVSVPSKRESGELLPQACNPLYAIQMANVILSHSILPFVDARKNRIGTYTEGVLELLSNKANDLIFRHFEYRFIPCTTKKAPQKCAIFWNAIIEFIVHESDSENSFALASRYKEPESKRQLRAHDLTICKIHNDG